ncbi:MAG: hypothetical protein ACI4DV_04025 [Lachnospiraceae bacterium]
MMKKRDRGSVMHLMSVILACMVTGLMAVFFTGWMQALDQKEEMDTIGRKYLLYMETKGYCTVQAMNQMEMELQQLGCENLDFTGTTLIPAGYGEEIELCIQGTVSYHLLGNSTAFFAERSISAPVRIYLTSTAKH